MIKAILNKQSKTITSAAIIIGFTSLTSRFLGMFRDRILAGTFGAGVELDMYYVAFRLPDLVYNLLVLGALSAGFVPVFIGYIKNFDNSQDNNEAWELVNNILNILIVTLIFICGIMIYFAPFLVKIIAPGFDLEQIVVTTKLIRIMFLSPIFLGLSSIFGGVLQSFKRFFVYSLAPIFYNLGIIIGALFFVEWWGIYGLAYGVILGAFLHLINQLGASFELGYRYKKIINLKHKGTRKISKMMAPRTLTLAVAQINLLVITIIASTLAKGSISVFNFANNLQSFPVGIFGVSFAIAAFPTLSKYASGENKEDFVKSFSSTFRQILFFVIPVSFLLIILRAQTVRIVLGSGQFDWNDTILTMNTLAFFAISLFSQSLSPLFVRGFYAYQDSQTPFYAALVGAVTNIVLSLFFTKFFGFGVVGLAFAFSIASWVNMSMLWIALKSKIGKMDGYNIFSTSTKIVFSALVATLITQLFKTFVGFTAGTDTVINLIIQTTVSGGIGLFVYGILCFVFKVEEMNIFIGSLKRRLLRFKKLPAIDIREDEDINVG